MGMETVNAAGSQKIPRRQRCGGRLSSGRRPVAGAHRRPGTGVAGHLRWCVSWRAGIHERLPQHVDIEDLVSAGVVGLMDAFSKFDPAKKVQFRSYAQFRIRGAILDSLRTLDWSPRELRRKGRAVEEAIRVLTARMAMRRTRPRWPRRWSSISRSISSCWAI